MNTATVFNVQRFSLHDGPGIRTTVFLKGCPLTCAWCHNPESMDRRPQPALAPERCLACGQCVAVCSVQVAGPQREDRDEDREACTWCGACGEACPGEARRLLGRVMSAPQLLAEVQRDLPFFASSGGGVTFSGGEPLAEPSAGLVLECLAGLRELGIHTAVDTCGLVQPTVLRRAAELAQLILYDLKLADDQRHRQATGAGNELIVANLERLLARRATVQISIPLVPGWTDDDANLEGLARLLLQVAAPHEPPPVRLLPYHPAGGGKYARLGLEEKLAGVAAPSPEHVDRCAALLAARGLQVTVGGKP